MTKNKQKKVDNSALIFDIAVNGTRKSQVLSKIWLQRKKMLHVATLNPEYIMEARTNSKFKSILAQCLTVADGHGVVWGLGKQVERISGVELVSEILRHAQENKEKVFLLGAGPGVAERAAYAMQVAYPDLQIASYEGAECVREEESGEASMTIAKINGFEPDYLLVAYGSPWQDIWIEENRPYLRARVAMGVGGVLDEWAGVVKLCPAWIDQIGLKWAWRVVHEPWRLRRIMRVFQFGLLVLYQKLID